MTAEAEQVSGDLSVMGLMVRARMGDQNAWDALVEWYAPLIWSICRRYRLSNADAHDVGQSVWSQLVDQLDRISDPAALPGWLATATRCECERVGGPTPGPQAAERRVTVLEAFLHLPPRDQQLMKLLVQDSPLPFAEISMRMGTSVDSIGPWRHRCLERLRRGLTEP
jgi:DNA-directed RNA polymerase specialized sigma24 family protein